MDPLSCFHPITDLTLACVDPGLLIILFSESLQVQAWKQTNRGFSAWQQYLQCIGTVFIILVCGLSLNKANLRDLIAATDQVILLKLDSNCRFFSPCDLEIWWMTLKNNRAPLLCYIKLCASFPSHRWIQTGVTVRKLSIQVKMGSFLSRVTLTFYGWPWKTIGHLFYATSSFVHHFQAMGEFKLGLQPGNAQIGSKWAIFCPVWPWTLTGDLEKQ